MNLSGVVRRHPVSVFFGLSFVISWAVWAPLVIYYYSSPFEVSFSTVPTAIILAAFLGFFGPTISGIILARVVDGRGGIKKLLSGWKPRVSVIVWCLGILTARLLLDVLAYFLTVKVFHAAAVLDWSRLTFLGPAFLQAALMGGAIAEETGWRGFALPRLMASRSGLSAGLLIGIIWAVWHLPVCLVPGANFPVPTTPPIFLVFFLKVVSFSVILSWVYVRTGGSLFACYVLHALLNTPFAGTVVRFTDFNSGWWIQSCVGAAVFLFVAIVLVLASGRLMLKRPVVNAPVGAR